MPKNQSLLEKITPKKSPLTRFNELFNKMLSILPSATNVYAAFFTLLIVTSHIATATAKNHNPTHDDDYNEDYDTDDTLAPAKMNPQEINTLPFYEKEDSDEKAYALYQAPRQYNIYSMDENLASEMYEAFIKYSFNAPLAQKLTNLIEDGQFYQAENQVRSYLQNNPSIGAKTVFAELLFQGIFNERYDGEGENYFHEIIQEKKKQNIKDNYEAEVYWSAIQVQTYFDNLPDFAHPKLDPPYTALKATNIRQNLNKALAYLYEAKQHAAAPRLKEMVNSILYHLAKGNLIYIPHSKVKELIESFESEHATHSYYIIYFTNHEQIARKNKLEPIPKKLLEHLKNTIDKYNKDSILYLYLRQFKHIKADDTHCMLAISDFLTLTKNTMAAAAWLKEAAERGHIEAAIRLINQPDYYRENEGEAVINYGIKINYITAYKAQTILMFQSKRYERFFETLEEFLNHPLMLKSVFASEYARIMLEVELLLKSKVFTGYYYVRSNLILARLYYFNNDILATAHILLQIYEDAAFQDLPSFSLLRKEARKLFKDANDFINKNTPTDHRAGAILQWAVQNHDQFLKYLERFLDEKKEISYIKYTTDLDAIFQFKRYLIDRRLSPYNSVRAGIIYARLLIETGDNLLAFQLLHSLCDQELFQTLPSTDKLIVQIQKILNDSKLEDKDVLSYANKCQQLIDRKNPQSFSGFSILPIVAIVAVSFGAVFAFLKFFNKANTSKSNKKSTPAPRKKAVAIQSNQTSTPKNRKNSKSKLYSLKQGITPQIIKEENQLEKVNNLLNQYKLQRDQLFSDFEAAYQLKFDNWQLHKKLVKRIADNKNFMNLKRRADIAYTEYKNAIEINIQQLKNISLNYTNIKDYLSKLSFATVETEGDARSINTQNHLDNITQSLQQLETQYQLLKNIEFGDKSIVYGNFEREVSRVPNLLGTINFIRIEISKEQLKAEPLLPDTTLGKSPKKQKSVLDTLEDSWDGDRSSASISSSSNDAIIEPISLPSTTSAPNLLSKTVDYNSPNVNYRVYQKTSQSAFFSTFSNVKENDNQSALSKKQKMLKNSIQHIQEILTHYRLHTYERDANENRQLADQTDKYALYYHVLLIIVDLYESQRNTLTREKINPALHKFRQCYIHADILLNEEITFIDFCDLLIKENISLEISHIQASKFYQNLSNHTVTTTLIDKIQELTKYFVYLKNVQNLELTWKNIAAIKTVFTLIGEVYNKLPIFNPNSNKPELFYGLDVNETVFANHLRKISSLRNKISHNQNYFTDSDIVKQLLSQTNDYSQAFIDGFFNKIIIGMRELEKNTGKAERSRAVNSWVFKPTDSPTEPARPAKTSGGLLM